MINSDLAASLSGLHTGNWVDNHGPMGLLLESFVVWQLTAQATWTDPDLKLWHYRDHYGTEADAVLTRGRNVWDIEVKASTSAGPGDGRDLARPAADCGKNFRGGAVLYAGNSVLPLEGGRMLAVPAKELWERCPGYTHMRGKIHATKRRPGGRLSK